MMRSILLLGLVLTSLTATAQDGQVASENASDGQVASENARGERRLTVEAQLRTRGEYNNGAIRPRMEGEEAATFVNDRARLSMDYQQGNLELKLGLQHAGVWGQDAMKERQGSVAMNEAWAKLRFGGDFFAQVGRQPLSYDDERLLGSYDWDVAGNYHDALRLGYEKAENKVHLIAAFNQTAENDRGTYYNGPMPYKSMVALWYHYDMPTLPLGASVLLMNIGREIGISGFGRTNFMQTLGTHVSYSPATSKATGYGLPEWLEPVVDASASFYYQTGRNPQGYSISAWMASLKASADVLPELRVHAGYDYLSGNSLGSKTINAFDPLFGSHHRFYGAMDYFTGQMLSGLQDIQLGASTTALKGFDVQLDYHYFLTTHNLLNYGKGLGSEFDLRFSTRLMKDVHLSGGYSFMLGTQTMEVVRSGSHHSWQDWAWLSLDINL